MSDLIIIVKERIFPINSILSFFDQKLLFLFAARIRILKNFESFSSIFIVLFKYQNKNLHDKYEISVKKFHEIYNNKWKNLLSYIDYRNSLFSCIELHNENEKCIENILLNYNLTYRGNILNKDSEVLKNYRYHFKIENDISVYIMNQNGTIAPNSKYEYDKIEICDHDVCFNKRKRVESMIMENEIPKCKCEEGFTGTLCENRNRCSRCKDKICYVTMKCQKCKFGWTGDNCETRSCKYFEMCNGHGSCQIVNGHRKCICNDGYGGKLCSVSCSMPHICPPGDKCKIINNRILCAKSFKN